MANNLLLLDIGVAMKIIDFRANEHKIANIGCGGGGIVGNSVVCPLPQSSGYVKEGGPGFIAISQRTEDIIYGKKHGTD